MIIIGKMYVVGNTGSRYEGRYVIPLYTRQDGQFCCAFAQQLIESKEYDVPTSFEEGDLITIKEYKEKCAQQSEESE